MEVVRIAIVLVILLLPSIAHAQKRVALVVGNSAYTKVGKLPNPIRDAEAMDALFRRAGFDVVETRRDVGVAPYAKKGVQANLVNNKAIAIGAYSGLPTYSGDTKFPLFKAHFANGIVTGSSLNDVVNRFGEPQDVSFDLGCALRYPGVRFAFNKDGRMIYFSIISP